MSVDSSSRQWLQRLMPRTEWGIIASIVVMVLALLVPPYLFSAVAGDIIQILPIGINSKLSIAHISITLATIGVIIGALAVYGKNLKTIGLGRPTAVHAGRALAGFAVYFAITVVLAMLAQALTNIDQEQAQNIGYRNLASVEFAAAFVSLVVLTPLAEELLFRGFMFQGFRRRLPFWAAAIGVSALFGLVHGQWNVGLDVFAMSLVSCYLVEKSGSLWPSIFLHMYKNGVAFWLLYIYNGG